MRRLLAVWAAGLAALVLAAPAQAIDPNSQFDQPAAGQYIETLPGSGGPTAPGIGGHHGGPGAPLSPQALAQLRRGGGSLTGPLSQLATSRKLGAPSAPADKSAARRVAAQGDHQSFLGSLVDAAAPHSGSGATLWLILALVAVTAVAAGRATLNRRQSRRLAG
jgi:hypothetical protein